MERYLVDAPPAHNRGGEVLGDAAHRVSHLHTAITARISRGGTEHSVLCFIAREKQKRTKKGEKRC
jgi:hypothetical protein